MTPDYIESARKALEAGNFQEVQQLVQDGRIPQSQVDLLANNAFIVLNNRKNYTQAVKLGKTFELPAGKILEAVQRNFTDLILDGHFDRAIEWGKSNGLSPKEIEDAAVKYARSCFTKGEVEKALEIKKDYSIDASILQSVAEEACNKAFQNKNYDLALRLTEEFEVTENRLWMIINKALEKYAHDRNWPKLLDILSHHHLLEEHTFEKIRIRDQISISELLTEIMKENQNGENFDFVINFIDKSGVLNRIPQNPQLNKLYQHAFYGIAEIHKAYLLRGSVAEAITISEKFKLLDSSVPGDVRQSVFSAARYYHDDLLKKGDYERASRIRKHYVLFESDGFTENIFTLDDAVMIFLENALYKAEIDKAIAAVKEYRIAKEQVRATIKKIIRDCMEKKSFPPVFEILKKFPLPSDDKELIFTAENHFDDAMKDNQFELAAELAFYFKLKREISVKAAYRAWEKHMQYGRIDDALKLKKRHRLPSDMTGVLAKESYQHFLRTNPDAAKRIRNEYQIDLGMIEIIMEIVRKILMMMMPTRN